MAERSGARQHKPNLPRASTFPLPLALPQYYISDTMTDDLTTKPTLETLLVMMREVRDTVNKRFDALEESVDRLETRMDRVESIALEVRADLRDLKKQFKEHLPALK